MFGIDFTGNIASFHNSTAFGQEIIHLIRENLDAKHLVVVDKCWGLVSPCICLVKDHINLTGNNPLIGPNPDCGDRFFKMTDAYVDGFDNWPVVITAGLTASIVPNANEMQALYSLGAQCWSYNLVPTAIVAAHASLKVIGVLLPAELNLDAKFLADLPNLLQEKEL